MRVPASIVLALRRSSSPRPTARRIPFDSAAVSSCHDDDDGRSLKRAMAEQPIEWRSDIELLLGQNVVRNWLSSSDVDDVALARYPGEWKFIGGATEPVDAGDLERTAKRELTEELLLETQAELDAVEKLTMRPFGVKRTRAVRGVAHNMHSFIALEDDQADDDIFGLVFNVEKANERLAARRRAHAVAVADRSFFAQSREERMQLSPEVHEVAFHPLDVAAHDALTSLILPMRPVNAYQAKEYKLYGVAERDPMYQTLRIVLDLEREFGAS